MTAVTALDLAPCPFAAPLPRRIGGDVLSLLRREAARARTAPHLDFFAGCAQCVRTGASPTPAGCARALIRVLGQALGRKPLILRDGSADRSFDEAWIVTLCERLHAGDWDSVEFLLRRQLPLPYRRSVAVLVGGLGPAIPRDAGPDPWRRADLE